MPIACTHHDIDSELLRLRAQRVDTTIVRRYLNLQAARSERAARQLCPRFAVNVMMSEVDAGRLRSLAPGTTTTVVPNGTDTEYFRPNGTKSVAGRVVFVGPTYSFPNRDAVEGDSLATGWVAHERARERRNQDPREEAALAQQHGPEQENAE